MNCLEAYGYVTFRFSGKVGFRIQDYLPGGITLHNPYLIPNVDRCFPYDTGQPRLSELLQEELESNVVTYSSAISACDKGGQWRRSVHLLAELLEVDLQPNVITCTSVVSSCGKSEQWKQALYTFKDMQERCFRV